MPLPKAEFRGKTAVLTMMEFRAAPGEAVEAAAAGCIVRITKSGKHIVTLAPPNMVDDMTVVHPDGTTDGPKPVTFRQDLGGEYGGSA